MTRRPLRHVDLRTPIGRIEALYRDIEDPAGVAVVCHPLPTHGGTLHNKVVFRAARGLEAANIATIRFNFRGVGTSQGVFDEGEGEMQDFEAALEWITRKHPGIKVFAGGFSFGSWVATRAACARAGVDALFLLGTPVNKYNFSYLKHCDKPKIFIHGSEDEFGNIAKLEALAGECSDAETVIVTGADHFFKDQLEVIEGTLQEWATEIVQG